MQSQTDGPIFYPDLEDALLGMGERNSMEPTAIYSVTKIIKALVGQGMEDQEAWDYFGFNIEGMFVGERTPILLYDGDTGNTS